MKTDLVGEKVILRPWKASDAPELVKMANASVTRWTTSLRIPKTVEEAVKNIRKKQRNFREGRVYSFAIVSRETGRLAGSIGLFKIDKENKNAEVGYWIRKDYWNKGLATEAVQLVLGFAFKNLKLHRVYARTFKENTASARVLEKAGFTKEGVDRECYRKNGRWHDLVRYGILKKEYDEKGPVSKG